MFIFKIIRRLVFFVFISSLLVFFVFRGCSVDFVKNKAESFFSKSEDYAPSETDQFLVDQLVKQVSTEYQIREDQVKVVSIEPRIWSSSCMDVDGIDCNNLVTSGIKVVIEIPQFEFTFHVSTKGDTKLAQKNAL